MITGKDFIALGYKPGKQFKEALEYANQHRLNGEALKNYLEEVSPKHIEPYDTSIAFHLNIKAETDDKVSNIEAVVSNMKKLLVTPTLVGGAVMPDACLTGEGQIPVGGVVIAKNAIHPSMHNADICCSVMMTNFGYQPENGIG